MQKVIIALLAALLFGSCDCVQSLRGKKIVDSETQQPLECVRVTKVVGERLKEQSFYSDSTGRIERGSYISGGLLPRCPDLVVLLEKEGYETRILNWTKNLDTIVWMKPRDPTQFIPHGCN